MMKKMRTQSLLTVVFFALSLCGSIITVGSETVAEKCSKDFDKVTTCLNYATGKAATPTKECCSAVSDIRESDPVCLCYVIQQANNGSEQIKSLGIQVAKLLQLPSACKLLNASVSNCPKLLNIPPSSPDYAIFTNATYATNTSTPTPTTTSTPTKADDKSDGFTHGPHLAAGPVAIAMALFFYAFLVGSASTFYT